MDARLERAHCSSAECAYFERHVESCRTRRKSLPATTAFAYQFAKHSAVLSRLHAVATRHAAGVW
jgi:hypothetical protein